METRKSFTLIELLVVIAIVALISSVVLVSMQGTREKARVAYCQKNVNGGLMGYWSFNEGAGSVVSDLSINLNEGIWQGTGAHWTDGKVGKAGQFNGSNDYVDMGSDFTKGLGAMTLALWVKANTVGQSGVIAGPITFGGAYDGAGLGISGSNFLWSVRTDNAVTENIPTPSDTSWHFLAGTYDGSNIYFYKDGALLDSSALTGNVLSDWNVWRIGRSPHPNIPYWFDGIIDEVRVYNRALSASEIKCHYQLKHFGS